MNGDGLYSGPELELASSLTELGWRVTPRQIRTWRARGWIVQADVRPQGYAKPTVWTNPPEAFEQARSVAEARGSKRINPHRLVLRLFGKGHEPLPLDQIKESLSWSLADMTKAIEKAREEATRTGGTPAEIVGERAAKGARKDKSGRRLLGRAGGGDKAAGMVGTAFTVIASGLLGEDTDIYDIGSDDAIDEMIDMSGMRGLFEDQAPNTGPIVTGGRAEVRSDLLDYFQAISLSEIEECLAEASYDELCTYRDQLKVVVSLGVLMAENVHRTDKSKPNAFGLDHLRTFEFSDENLAIVTALFLPQIRRLGASVVAQSTAQLAPELPRQQAIDLLYSEMPTPLRRYLGAGGAKRLSKASDVDQQQFVEALSRFDSIHPGSLQLAIRHDE